MNWADNSAPVSDLVNTDLFCGGTVRLTPNFSAVFSADSLTFNGNLAANAFTFGGSGLTIGTTGIVNYDAETRTFLNQVTLGTATSTFNTANGALAFSTLALGANALTLAGPASGLSSITTVTSTGSIAVNNATFNANGNVLSSGQITRDATGVFTVASGKTPTLQAGGDATFTGAFATGTTTTDGENFLITGAGSSVGPVGFAQ